LDENVFLSTVMLKTEVEHYKRRHLTAKSLFKEVAILLESSA
jgi:hypothetical protein